VAHEVMTKGSDLPSPEEHGYRLASLRWFLRFYQRFNPAVVSELHSRVLPAYIPVLRLAQQVSKPEQEAAFRNALRSWIRDFGLPETADMVWEALQTLLTPARGGRPVFGDSAREIIRALEKEGAPPWTFSYPFAFQARGWTPARETIDGAAKRLREEYDAVLKEHVKIWEQAERTGADLLALWKRDRKHIRDIRWLAHKQAVPGLSVKAIAERTKGKQRCTPKTVWRGLHSAADCLGLPRVYIRQARRGRKPRSRSV
jgi:hypothetical protein